MTRIVVPTDFSKNAKNAYDYASRLSDYLDGQISVVNICHPTTDSINGVNIPLLPELVESHEEKLDNFVHTEKSNTIEGMATEALIEKEVIIGLAGEELVNISKKEDTDLLVMGTTGKSGFLEKVFGSVSSIVSQKAECPVWLVPPNTQFEGLQNILYASNYQSADEEMVQQIVRFAKTFDSNVHMVHVQEEKMRTDDELDKILIEQLFRRKAPALEFNMSILKSNSVWKGLFNYAEEHQIDLIVLVTKHRKFWERLIHKSITKEMVLHAKVPLLILHLDNQLEGHSKTKKLF